MRRKRVAVITGVSAAVVVGTLVAASVLASSPVKLTLVSERQLPNGEVEDTYRAANGGTIVVTGPVGSTVTETSESHSGSVTIRAGDPSK